MNHETPRNRGFFDILILIMASPTKVKAMDRTFSKYIRLRDTLPQYTEAMFICCSCGQMKTYDKADAGHFINRRWMALRWREDNVHAQCSSCNRFDEGNAVGYTLFMINKYGKDHVEMLMALKNATQKWTDWELAVLNKLYQQKTKDLTNERSSAMMV